MRYVFKLEYVRTSSIFNCKLVLIMTVFNATDDRYYNDTKYNLIHFAYDYYKIYRKMQ